MLTITCLDLSLCVTNVTAARLLSLKLCHYNMHKKSYFAQQFTDDSWLAVLSNDSPVHCDLLDYTTITPVQFKTLTLYSACVC